MGFIEGVGRSGRQEGVCSRKRGSMGCVLSRLNVKKVCGVGKGIIRCVGQSERQVGAWSRKREIMGCLGQSGCQ
jgi:hypothetical protein